MDILSKVLVVPRKRDYYKVENATEVTISPNGTDSDTI